MSKDRRVSAVGATLRMGRLSGSRGVGERRGCDFANGAAERKQGELGVSRQRLN